MTPEKLAEARALIELLEVNYCDVPGVGNTIAALLAHIVAQTAALEAAQVEVRRLETLRYGYKQVAQKLIRQRDALRSREAEKDRRISELEAALREAHKIADSHAAADLAQQDRADRIAEYPVRRDLTPMMRLADMLAVALADGKETT